ncbi:MAG TPA: hypothetical protein PLP05_11050, partial [Sedimentisphaerales bacterium]|nr:hypothetical protein [Sedimentisphaerales bacterium]
NQFPPIYHAKLDPADISFEPNLKIKRSKYQPKHLSPDSKKNSKQNQSNTHVRSFCDNKNKLIVNQKGEKKGKKAAKIIKKSFFLTPQTPLHAYLIDFLPPKTVKMRKKRARQKRGL